jgi:hypothetical protein
MAACAAVPLAAAPGTLDRPGLKDVVDKDIDHWLIRTAMLDCIMRTAWANWRWDAGVGACAAVL